MLGAILRGLHGLPKEWVVLVVATLPIAELRLAIPLGLSFGMPLAKVFMLSLIGNIIPVAPILFLLAPVSQRLRRFKLWARFFDWLFTRTKKRAEAVQKYEALGLALFVGFCDQPFQFFVFLHQSCLLRQTKINNFFYAECFT